LLVTAKPEKIGMVHWTPTVVALIVLPVGVNVLPDCVV